MSLSDHFKSFLGKSGDDSAASSETSPSAPPAPSVPQAAVPEPSPAPASPTLEEIDRLLEQQRREADAHLKALAKDIQATRALLDKSESVSRSRREDQEQTLQFLQEDAEREIKFLERKLQEDLATWNRQLSEREKTLQQTTRHAEASHAEEKSTYSQQEHTQADQIQRTEQLLKEQEAKLVEERQKWRQMLQQKEDEFLVIKSELSRRESELESELAQQDAQRKATQALWQTRIKDLERQWLDKRSEWETSLKAKEEERLKVQTTFQEKQTTWQLEQERRLQDMGKRHERASEKLAALQSHLVKETAQWQQLSQTREEQLQKFKVKLLLSESDSKGRIEQTQKVLQEMVTGLSGKVHHVQQQYVQQQSGWIKQLEEKDQQMATLKEDIRSRLRGMETDFNTRMGTRQIDKDALNAQMQTLQTDYDKARQAFEKQQQVLREDQAALEAAHQKTLSDLNGHATEQETSLQQQIMLLESKKSESEQELQKGLATWQDDLKAKEQTLKEAHNASAPLEAEMRKNFAEEEETLSRQTDGLRTRHRTLERDLLKVRETMQRAEVDHRSSIEQLEKDYTGKEVALRQRSVEQDALLRSRLEERRVSLDQFLNTKKEQEVRIHNQIRSKEKERLDWAARIEQLPKEMSRALEARKAAVGKETESLRQDISNAEVSLAAARELSKADLQAGAGQLATLRQMFDHKQKELSSAIHSQEQIFDSERATLEKQMATTQADIERVRTQWQAEVDKKDKEIQALKVVLEQKETEQHRIVEQEQARLAQEIVPLETQRQTLHDTIDQERARHAESAQVIEKQAIQAREDVQKQQENEKAERAALEVRFRQERAQWKAKLEGRRTERNALAQTSEETIAEKARLTAQLEEQFHQQTLAFEARKRELIHAATLKARTLQDLLRQAESELQNVRESFPLDLKHKEETLARLNHELSDVQARHAQAMARYDRALSTLARRSKKHEEALHSDLVRVKEESAAKIAAKDTEITALQSNLLAQENERQGELDRLAKQFAEERFQLEKAKEDVEWKLKDQKEVAERQLAGRQKEVQFLEAEVQRVKTLRDQEIAQKSTAFETEKTKLQTGLRALQSQMQDDKKSQESAFTVREEEMQTLLTRSKDRLRILSEEFNQKVNLWKSTNEMLRSQSEQMKGHLTQAQDHWEALRKEKSNEINTLRQDLAAWEVRIQTDVKALEQANEQDRSTLIAQIRRLEKEADDQRAHFAHQRADQEEKCIQIQNDIQNKESCAEVEWQASLDQWQRDKQALHHDKTRLEKELQDFQARSEQELQQMDEQIARLRMEVTFKESELNGQRDRMEVQHDKDLSPLQSRMTQLTLQMDEEKQRGETELRRKEDDLKTLVQRLAMRDHRLQEESKRRARELETLQKQVTDEAQQVRSHYEQERQRLDRLLKEKQDQLAILQHQYQDASQVNAEAYKAKQEAVRQERQHLEAQLQQLQRQREELQAHYRDLIETQVTEINRVEAELQSRDTAIEDLRQTSRQTAESLRKRLEQLRQTRRGPARSGPSNAVAWNAFEQGVAAYQKQDWSAAALGFEQCLSQDPRWGAAYQYLALSYHAQGDTVRALQVASRAFQEDSGNAELSNWVDRLQQLIQKKAS